MLGKCNMDEFAMGSSNETSFFGAVKTPGTSIACPGAARAVLLRHSRPACAPLVTGTDTGGSIRQPASLCGITGLKPTYGRVSGLGIIAFASSLDQAGPMARSGRLRASC
jgi:aspartyl-tRNA(Asn)/glutamyl-tRNA(Gln) amidotransferase subunit A